MGLGKSVITMTLLREYLQDEFRINKVLVIAPLKVAEDTWSREAEKWDHLHGLRVVRVLGTEKQRLRALETESDIYVINRENVVWLVEHYGKKWPFDALVIDELSSFKSTKAKRWRMLKRVAPLCKVVWGLTGTLSDSERRKIKEEREREEAQLRAFQQLLDYNPEIAYGLGQATADTEDR